MFRIKATLRQFIIEAERYKRALATEMEKQLRVAAEAWFRAAIAEIPVWSGASRATFIPLATHFNFTLSISPKIGVNRIGEGVAAGSFTPIIDPAKGRFLFKYETSLAHLIYNEFNNANLVPDDTLFFRLLKPGPYGFQGKAADAFLERAAKARLPNPFNFLKITTRRV